MKQVLLNIILLIGFISFAQAPQACFIYSPEDYSTSFFEITLNAAPDQISTQYSYDSWNHSAVRCKKN